MITDFFIATEAEVVALDLDAMEGLPFPTCAAQGVDPVKLASLQALHPTHTMSRRQYDPVNLSAHGAAVVAVPSALVEAWSGWSDETIDDLGRRWAQTEELRMDRWEEAEAVAFLREMRSFLQAPRPSGAQVWLYLGF